MRWDSAADAIEVEPGYLERALILLPEDKTEQAVLDCAKAGIKHVWLHRHVAGGVSDTRAIYRAEENGIQLITGFCILMFLPRTASMHKLHGGVMRIVEPAPGRKAPFLPSPRA